MAGTDPVIAKWREAGKWWEFEPYKEFTRISGEKREIVKTSKSLGLSFSKNQNKSPENHKEEWNLRERKIRDEKVAAACGQLPPQYYELQAAQKETAWSVITGAGSSTPLRNQGYVALHCLSGYTFGRSVMLAEEIATLCALGGCSAAAIVDQFSLAGAIEFSKACKRNGIQPLIGMSVELEEGGWIVLIAKSKRGYRCLSLLATECHLSEERLFPLANWNRLAKHSLDLICLTGGDLGPIDRRLARKDYADAAEILDRLIGIYGSSNVFVEIERSHLPWQRKVEKLLLELATEKGVLAVAGGVVTHARRDQFIAQDVLVCADTLCLIDEVIGRKPTRSDQQPQIPPVPIRAINAERFLKTEHEMAALFHDRIDLIENARKISENCDLDVLPGRTSLPPLFPDDAIALREIIDINKFSAYKKITRKIDARLNYELERVISLGFSTHFLVAFDMVRWSKEQGIQLSGRGSVVDSALAYVLGFSRIDAIQHNLHFDRFLPADGNKRPDIDIDFEARRRDDVRGYLTQRYGVERVATVCAFGAYCSRGIVREVGKVFGIPDHLIGFLAKKIHGGVAPDKIEQALQNRPELREHHIPIERFRWVIRLAERLMDVPRNIRSHSSGVVISSQPIAETVPVQWGGAGSSKIAENSDKFLRIIQWDKRSSKVAFDKFDILCLRGQDVLSDIHDKVTVKDQYFDVSKVTLEDEEAFRAFRSGELIGIPQSASPAMRQAHVRLKTQNLEDASLVQAGIRPGVGGAVKMNELIARRSGAKPYSFLHPKLEEILGHTYGIIVFQEQVDQLLQEFCGCSSGEAEDIRDSIHKRRREDFGQMIKEKIIERVLSNGHSVAIAEQVFDYVAGFKGYGFAQGHALAFAEISVRCVHLMQNHPAEYFAALLNAQPAGYYGPCTIANEARSRGVSFARPCVNSSSLGFTVDETRCKESGLIVPGGSIRIGFHQIQGLSKGTKRKIEEIHEKLVDSGEDQDQQPFHSAPLRFNTRVKTATQPLPKSQKRAAFSSFFDFVHQVQPNRDELEQLILAGAFDCFCTHRRALLWAVPSAYQYSKSLQGGGENPMLPMLIPEPELHTHLADMDEQERAAYERMVLCMDVDAHLMAFERPRIAGKAVTTQEARRLTPGVPAIVVGNPIRLRFPPTPSGKRVVFFDLEDETGLLNVTCFDRVYQECGKAIVTAPYVTLFGESQNRDGHTAFLASRVIPYRPMLLRDRIHQLPVRNGDFLMGGNTTPKLA